MYYREHGVAGYVAEGGDHLQDFHHLQESFRVDQAQTVVARGGRARSLPELGRGVRMRLGGHASLAGSACGAHHQEMRHSVLSYGWEVLSCHQTRVYDSMKL